MNQKFRLGVVFTHPTQHHGPLWKKLSEQSNIDLKVLFLCDENQKQGDKSLGNSAQAWDVDLLNGYDYDYLKGISGKVASQLEDIEICPGLLNQLTPKNFDAIFMQSFVNPSYRLAALLCKLRGIPLIMQNDATIISDGRYSRLRQMLLPVLYPLMLNLADYWLSCGDHNEIHLRHYGIAEEKIIRGCHPVDGERFDQVIADGGEEVEKIRQQLCWDNDTVLFGYVAKYCDRKKPFEFIDALEKAHQADPRVRGIMIGGGELEADINRRLATMHGEVINIGFVNQSKMPLYFAAMDVFVLTSRFDPHPLVASEAMSAYCPVIMSDGCGNWGYSDTLIPYHNGLVYPRGKTDLLSKAVLQLMDFETRQTYSKNARKAFDRQNLYTAVDSFQEVIKKLKQGQGAKAIPLARESGKSLKISSKA